MDVTYRVHKENCQMFGPEEVWVEIDRLCGSKVPDTAQNLQPRRGWKTVRIFVSSTFKDFHYERDVLVKQVFPELREWCQKRKLYLVECDLRWGAPDYFTSEDKVKLCLDEIRRCSEENNQKPFFINMISKRVGWIPKPDEPEESDKVDPNVLKEYRLVFGLSVTEMEIVYGAYSTTNPNALFLVRDDSFFETIPLKDEVSRRNFDYDNFAKQKIPLLKSKLTGKFHKNKEAHFLEYFAKFNGYSSEDPKTRKVKLAIQQEDKVCHQILEFFKERIGGMYPPFKDVEDKFIARRLDHEAFMDDKAQDVLGREDVLVQITKYIRGELGDVALLLFGKPGIGKSSIMAKAALDAVHSNAMIPSGKKRWHVFYHFVGAVPGSTELRILLHRILRDVMNMATQELPSDLEDCVATVNSALNKEDCPHVILFVDALNQFDDDHPSVGLVNWLPKKLSDRVRCVFSMVPDSAPHKSLASRESKPHQIHVTDLSLVAREKLVEGFLAKYNKKFEDKQMKKMLSKASSANPLWLTIACEEMRVHGNFRTVTETIENLPEHLSGLLEQVFSRLENEGNAVLVKATLCLIEVSKRGLLETELIYILGDIYFHHNEHKETKKKSEASDYSDEHRLPALQWTKVTRALGTFLRPYGGLNEGRLDFYHRAVSKAVRHKYLEVSEGSTVKQKWHEKLAHFFQHCSLPLERRIEEYPYHLTCLGDGKRLKSFLADWPVFDLLYDREFSRLLLDYWKHCGGSGVMAQTYTKKLEAVPQDQKLVKYEQVGRICLQGGEYDCSTSLAEKGLKLLQRKEDLVSLVAFYTLLADSFSHRCQAFAVVEPENMPFIKEALKYSEKSVKVLSQLKEQDSKHLKKSILKEQEEELKVKKLYGQYLMHHAFNFAAFGRHKGDNTMTPLEASDTGLTYIHDAIKIFEKLEDKGMLVEAVMTKGILYQDTDNFGMHEKTLKKAEELCKEVYGDTHLLMPRILKNLANAYFGELEDTKAFECYVKCIKLYHQLFGADHPKTKSAYDYVHTSFKQSRFGSVHMEGNKVYTVSPDGIKNELVD